MAWSKLVSTEMDDDQKTDMMMPFMPGRDVPDYPHDMKIALHDWLLDRLGLDSDVEVGDYLDMRCFAVVTSVSKHEVNGEPKCTVCLTLEKISVENESDESAEEDGEDD